MSFLSSTRNNSSHANVSRLTDSYHQTILSLAESSNTDTEIPWQVTQHVLDRVWCTTSSPNNDASTSTTVTDVDDTVVYACQGCGYLLHPGWKGTNLRVKRSHNGSASMRRRKQRKRRRVARAEEMKAQDIRNNRRRSFVANTNKNTSSGDSATTAELQHRLVLLQDDESCTTDRPVVRNHLVLTCGRCRDKTHLKGLLQQQLKTTSPIVAAPTYKKKMNGGSGSDGNGNLADNFVSLPPARSSYQANNRKKKTPPQVVMSAAIAATIATSSTTKSSSSSSPSISLLEQKREEQFGARKRKKKAKSISSDKKTGNLLDFLSSLNDH